MHDDKDKRYLNQSVDNFSPFEDPNEAREEMTAQGRYTGGSHIFPDPKPAIDTTTVG